MTDLIERKGERVDSHARILTVLMRCVTEKMEGKGGRESDKVGGLFGSVVSESSE